MCMSREELALALLRIAEQDLEASKLLFEHGLYPQAIFYAQQCCEKAYKAFLVFIGLANKSDLRHSISHYPFSKGLQFLVNRSIEELRELMKEHGIDEKSFEKLMEPYLRFLQLPSLTNFIDNLVKEVKNLVGKAVGELSVKKLCSPITKDLEKQIDEIISIVASSAFNVEIFLESIMLGSIISELSRHLHVNLARLGEKLDKVLWRISGLLFLAEAALYIFLIASMFLERFAEATRYPSKIDPSKDIKHNSIITKIAKDFINFVERAKTLRYMYELISGDIRNENLRKVLEIRKELIKTQIKLHIKTNKL